MKFSASYTLLLIATFVSGNYVSEAQIVSPAKEITALNTPATALEPLRFLASDELMGRATLRPEINIAARYISSQFQSLGLKQVQGLEDYFQPFTIQMVTPASQGTFTINEKTFEIGKDLLEIKGKDVSFNAPVVYAHHATKSDLDKLDVKGKIVVSEMGENDSSPFMEGFRMIEQKGKMLQEKGALALVERYKPGSFLWPNLQKYVGAEHPVINENTTNDFPAFLVKDDNNQLPATITGKISSGNIIVTGTAVKDVAAKNVMGWVEGTDPILKKQFVVLTAHYDHLGVAKKPVMEDGKVDSIYNGARDNAIGTTAVIDAARYFSKHPSKRSVLFIAYTAEEIGEIGSKYFAAHPPMSLKQLVYNLNIDNASYNDTSIVTVVGLGRTSADNDIKKACTAFGLTALPDPAPEQNLFDRSDNTQLAVKGIPAPTFSLGIKKFNEEINKRYHQLSDEVGNFNLSYAMKYINSFILASKYIADNKNQPQWMKGDKYELAWKKLYQ